jgi:hypothetical protein
MLVRSPIEDGIQPGSWQGFCLKYQDVTDVPVFPFIGNNSQKNIELS